MSTDRLTELRDVAGTVSRETVERLGAFEAEFRRWAARINLAAPSTLDDLWRRHVLDSAQLARLKPNSLKWLDLGSGGGFPGAVLAILFAERPGARVDLVESNHKKAAFLRAVLGELRAPATVHVCRIEDARPRVPHAEIVTARALAPLPRLLGLCEPWISEGATALFHKGRDYAGEIKESHDAWRFDLILHQSRIDPASRILEIARLQRAVAQPDAFNQSVRQGS